MRPRRSAHSPRTRKSGSSAAPSWTASNSRTPRCRPIRTSRAPRSWRTAQSGRSSAGTCRTGASAITARSSSASAPTSGACTVCWSKWSELTADRATRLPATAGRSPARTTLFPRFKPWRDLPRSRKGRRIRVHRVLHQHSLRVEEGAVECDGAAPDARERFGLAVEHHGHVLGFFVEGARAAPRIALGRLAADRPTSDALDAAFEPPAVEDAQARNAVEGRLHPARPRSFERPHRRVEPQIDAGGQRRRKPHVVVLEIDGAHRVAQRRAGFEDVANDRLPFGVVRVRLSAVDEQERPRRARDRLKALGVGEYQVRALIGGGGGWESESTRA